MTWKTQTGGQRHAIIRETEQRGGPKPQDYSDARTYWCEATEFWYFRYSEAFSDADDTLQ